MAFSTRERADSVFLADLDDDEEEVVTGNEVCDDVSVVNLQDDVAEPLNPPSMPAATVVAAASSERTDTSNKCRRYMVLVLLCLLTSGIYFCYDTPAALEDDILRELNLTHSSYALLYSVYAWPNVLFAVIGGILIDTVFGVGLGAIVFALSAVIGQILVALGSYVGIFSLMLLGRFVFALGGEPLAVAQNTYTVQWFRSNELNFVFGVTLGFSRLSSSLNLYTVKPLHLALSETISDGQHALGATLSFTCLTTIASLACAVVLHCAFNASAVQKVRREGTVRRMNQPPAIADAAKPHTKKQLDCHEKQENKKTRFFSRLNLKQMWSFPAAFWLICVVCVTYYVAIFPFISYGFLVYSISMIAAPCFGVLVDYVGRNVIWICTSISFTLVAHLLLAFTAMTPFVPMVLLGLAYSLIAASLWPSIAYVIPKTSTATAFGCLASIQNLGLGLAFM